MWHSVTLFGIIHDRKVVMPSVGGLITFAQVCPASSIGFPDILSCLLFPPCTVLAAQQPSIFPSSAVGLLIPWVQVVSESGGSTSGWFWLMALARCAAGWLTRSEAGMFLPSSNRIQSRDRKQSIYCCLNPRELCWALMIVLAVVSIIPGPQRLNSAVEMPLNQRLDLFFL